MKARVLKIEDSHMEFDYDFVTKIITKLKLEDNLEVRKDIKSILMEAKEIILKKKTNDSDVHFYRGETNSFFGPNQRQIDELKKIENLTNQENMRSKFGGLPSSNPPDPNKPKKNK